ncbi:restriction endonuclease subunit S [Leptospira weilii]|uniref:restriction endonuclease subunit S n=1 Tax=Leptospira weilii TaxID=28184 RepID=UPI000307250B
MSKSFMEKLLKGAKVEWKTLGEVGDFIRGSGIQKSNFTESGTGCIHYGQIHTHYGTWADETKSFINPEFAARLRKAHTGNLVIATTSEDDDALAKAVAWLGDEEVAVSTDAYIYRHTINPKYMSYFFQTELFRSQKKPYITGTKVRRISGESLAKIQIPIPPLPVQVEIVRILDAFTELASELTTELTARKKQYNYYRDQLLSFEEGEVEWRALGEVGNLVRGNGLPKTDFTESGVPAIHYGQIYTYYGLSTLSTKSFVSSETANKLKKVNKGDVIITNTSENLEDVGKAVLYLGEQQAVTGGHATIFKPSKIILGKYFVYCTQTNFFADEKRKYAKGTKVIDVSANDMAKIQIPIPPLAEQEEIVRILDKFDALTNSISEGLPREITLRQKQYEHYRELLLSFPKAEVDPK